MKENNAFCTDSGLPLRLISWACFGSAKLKIAKSSKPVIKTSKYIFVDKKEWC